ncbi:SOS response-associated peptidase [Microcella alkalica]|uniref:Abasic site processing protein n=1 Tax=Microcella alkalica TaxID=355930 RepID=A0A839E836_9MICO|nr:SOS response-associated peptidase [Microcella alkalica]MBA8848799.1 putative SOS response-associated peptidase YedK [Microcella alkalica]
MCGRYANTKSGEELGRYFEADEVDEVRLPPSWNIAPTQRIHVVVDTVPKDLAGSGGGAPVTRRVTTARWSLVPRFAKELTSRYPTFNARSETAAEKPTFRSAVVRSRALVPADGYYEWLTVGKTKTPYFVTDPLEGELAFAGLYSWWRPPVAEGEEPEPWVLTATILTRAAAGPAARIHDRIPVMLPRAEWDSWLDPTIAGDHALVQHAVAASQPVIERLTVHEVAPLRGDGPELVAPLNPL